MAYAPSFSFGQLSCLDGIVCLQMGIPYRQVPQLVRMLLHSLVEDALTPFLEHQISRP